MLRVLMRRERIVPLFVLLVLLLAVALHGRPSSAAMLQAVDDFSILLGRPTDHSVTLNIIPDQSGEISFEYGTASGVYGNQTDAISCTVDVPVESVIDELASNTRHYYRLRFRATSGDPWTTGDEHSFYTQRAAGSTFTFTIISDSHLGQYGGQTADQLALYQLTLQNVQAAHPDFHIDTGDTFAMDPSPLGTGMTEAEAEAAYLIQRPYLDTISASTPFFLAIGNHENEEGWNWDDDFDPPDSALPLVGIKARKLYFPNPIPDDFYTGNTDPLPQPIGGDSNREDYYAWEWGDALFVVLDPFHYSTIWPSEGSSYGGEGTDGEAQGDRWDWTLGEQQYLWLKDTLENSDATFKFVFTHHLTGGVIPYGRGGVGAAPYFEWGGLNWDGSDGFATERPGWEMPIHDLMVANGVNILFHGHDHFFSKEELDGIVYLEVPKPDDNTNATDYRQDGGGYPTGDNIDACGYIRVTVSPAGVSFDYIRSYLPGTGTNGEVAYSYSIPAEEYAKHLTLAVDPVGAGTTSPSVGTHSYMPGAVVTVTATANAGYTFDHWSGDCTGAGACPVTMDADKSVTAHFVPVPVGSIIHVADIGAASIKNASAADLLVTTSDAVAEGDDIIIAYATDPAADVTITISDPAGNTYQTVALGINSGNVRTYLFAAYHVHALPSASTITIHQTVAGTTAPAARAAAVSVFRGLAPVGALEQSSVATGSSTTPSSGAAITVQADQLLIGAVGTEGPGSDSAGTWQNSFNAGPRAGTTATTTDAEITISMGWQSVSAAGSYTAAKSGITSRDWATAIATFRHTAAGLTYIGDIGSAQSKTAGTSLAVTTNAAVAGGDDIMVAFATDPAGAVSSVTDSAGNTYNNVVDATNSSNVRTMILAAYNVAALPSGGSITIDHASVTARAAVVSVFRGLADSAVLDQTHTGTGNGTAPSSGATSTTTQADELLVGAIGVEGPHGDGPGTWLNSFSLGPRLGTNVGSSGGGDTDITAQLGWRIVNANGAYTAAKTGLSSSRDWAAVIATLKAALPVTASVQLASGWNLISLPLTPLNTAVTQTLSSIDGAYNLVDAYDAFDTGDPWKRYDTSVLPFINDLQAIDENLGLWVNATAPVSLIVTGKAPLAPSIPLTVGWNLVGYPSLVTRPVTVALSSCAGKWNLVDSYDAFDTGDPWKRYDTSVEPFINDLQDMAPGFGYWINMTQACTWIVP